ncbi:MAG: hypothetical protein AB1411_16060 [Nitrospirota bacterium]
MGAQIQTMDLRIGSNVFRNTNGILKVRGKEQLVLELDASPARLWLTMDLYTAKGAQIAHLRRNAWVLNEKDRFAVSVRPPEDFLLQEPARLTITDSTTQEVVLDVVRVDRTSVHILSGQFHAHTGQPVVITPHVCRLIGRLTLFGHVLDTHGDAAAIG